MSATIYQHDVESVTVKESRFLGGNAQCWSREIEIRAKDGSNLTITLFSQSENATLPAFEIDVEAAA